MNADESAGLVFILAFNFITKRLIASINSLLQSPQLQHIGYHYRMMWNHNQDFVSIHGLQVIKSVLNIFLLPKKALKSLITWASVRKQSCINITHTSCRPCLLQLLVDGLLFFPVVPSQKLLNAYWSSELSNRVTFLLVVSFLVFRKFHSDFFHMFHDPFLNSWEQSCLKTEFCSADKDCNLLLYYFRGENGLSFCCT